MKKYKKELFFGILVVVFLLFSVLIASRVSKHPQNLGSSAAGINFNYYNTTLNTYGLFGQKVIGSSTRNKVSGSTQEHAPGIVVDKSSTPNRIYVVDSGDSRILGYSGIGTCSNNSAITCTTDSDCGTGNSCNVPAKVINTKQADIVIGQPNFTSGACNGDDNLGWNNAPTASTLCLIAYPYGNNNAEQWGADNIDVDNQGNLYVTDTYNNRVLEYYQPFSLDKIGGKGDSVADFVWGQDDFTHNGRNRGTNTGVGSTTPLNFPDDHSLFTWTSGPKNFGGGNPAVSVDNQGNVWVSDTANHRILRFPQGSKTANLVIGQTDFTGRICNEYNGASLNQLCGTMQARVEPSSGDLYVLDRYHGAVGFISRILVFKAPFVNGMSAYKIITPKASNFVDWGGWDGKGTYYFQGSGFTFNPDKTDYPTGALWVTEHDADRVLLIDSDGNVVKTVNAIDAAHKGGNIPSGCPYYYNNGNGTGYGLGWPSSAVSFDSANNMYITAEEYSTGSHIVRFGLPYDTFANSAGTTCLPLPNGGLNWVAPVSNDTLTGGLGLAIYGNQLLSIHAQDAQNVYGGLHGNKMMVWNDYQTKAIGAASDYIVVRPGNVNMEIGEAKLSSAIDDLGRLWHASGDLNVFQLPITSNSPNVLASRIPLYWADDGTQITGTWITGVAYDPIGKALYLVDRTQAGSSRARILRVKNYTDPTSKLMVDTVIGQTNKTNVLCNQGLTTPNAGTICDVREIKFDKLGNLYAVDNDYECHGNRRITVFMTQDLNSATGMFPNLQAKKVFNEPDFTSTTNCGYWVTNAPGSPVSIAFDSMNHMVIGNDGYYGQAADQQRELKQLWFYSDPVSKQIPDASINIYMGTPGDMTFDSSDNLVFQDSTWNRIQMINLCTDPQLLSYLPGVGSVNTCSNLPSPTPTPFIPSPSPSSTPAPTPTSSPVSGFSASIISPANGSTVARGSTVTIAASVTSTNSITKVSFSVNGSIICTNTSAPYTCSWKVPSAKGKTYTIVVQAFDSANKSVTSSSIIVVAK